MRYTRLAVLAVFAPLLGLYSAGACAEFNLALESRNVYTRWYEYPGRYWEEDFSVKGLRAEYAHTVVESAPFALALGVSVGAYTGSYVNSPGLSFDANAVRTAALLQSVIVLQPNFGLVLRVEVPYWQGFGVTDHSYHSDDFAVYFPGIEIAGGVRYRFDHGAIKNLMLLYGVTVADFGVETDMYFRNTPVNENWAASALTLSVGF